MKKKRSEVGFCKDINCIRLDEYNDVEFYYLDTQILLSYVLNIDMLSSLYPNKDVYIKKLYERVKSKNIFWDFK